MRCGVEWAEGFDRIPEEVDAHGHLGVERVDVEDAAAQGKLARLFAEGFVGVAEIFRQPFGEIAERKFLALAHDDLRLGAGLGGGGAAGDGAWGASDE